MTDAARLLLVDDDQDFLPLIKDLLNAGPGSPWAVDWTYNVAEALGLLKDGHHQAALIDYWLGADTGLDVVTRARGIGVKTPLIMLTGLEDRGIDLAAMAAGADDFIRKSELDTDVLERALRYALRHAAIRRTIEEREAHFRALIQQSSDAIVLMDAAGRVTFASESTERVLGVSPAELTGSQAIDRVHPDDAERLLRELSELMKQPGRRVTVEYRGRHADGSWRHREVSAENRLNDPPIRAIVTNVRDITARRLAELQNDHLASIVESSRDAILSITLSGSILSWNAAAQRLYGYSAQEAVGRSALMLVAPHQHDQFQRMLETVATGESVQLEQQRIRKDGGVIWVSVTLSPVLESDGVISGASSVARDITAEVEARRALVDQEREYRSLFEESPVGLARTSLDGVWVDVNTRLCEMLGYTRSDLIGMPFIDITHPDDRADSLEARERLRSGAAAQYDVEKRYRAKDGSHLWARVRVSPYHDGEGVLRYFIVAITDVTARRAMEDELRSHVARLRAILAHLPVSIWVLDDTGVITLSEGRLLGRFGAEQGELVGRSLVDLFQDYPDVVTATHRALAGESVHMTSRIGDDVFEAWYTPLRDSAGGPAGTVGIATEITERLMLEEQFRQAQKMEAVGLLAGGVAHDFNNILTAIIGFGEMAKETLGEGQPLDYELSQILRAAHSASALTRQLLAFSRRQVLQPRVLDLAAAVRSMHALLSRVIGEDIRLDIEVASRHHVFADPGQIEQIVLNLAVNARDAMPAGGRLLLQTTDVIIDHAFVTTHRGATVGPHVRLAVTDTGVGMPEDVRRRIFEPFFTTKDLGRGTGLGLATVYGIVKQSGGSIWVDSEVGVGTTFTVLFPVATGALDAEPATVKPTSTRGDETILLVEDQLEVRTIARMILERQGYRVLEADKPSKALAIVQGGARPALLFTDVVMPEMSGRQLAKLLQDEHPSLKVLFTSGYTDDAIVNHGMLEPDIAFIAKPYTAHNLLSMVRKTIVE